MRIILVVVSVGAFACSSNGPAECVAAGGEVACRGLRLAKEPLAPRTVARTSIRAEPIAAFRAQAARQRATVAGMRRAVNDRCDRELNGG
jgi:hypothetical protein